MKANPQEIDLYSKSLSHSQLFHGIEEPALKALIIEGEIFKPAPSSVLVQLEGRVDGLHIILEGSAQVRRSGTLLATLGRGAFFGEISLFGVALGATAEITAAAEKTTLLVIKKAVLDSWSKKFAIAERSFLRHLCTELCRRLSAATDRITI